MPGRSRPGCRGGRTAEFTAGAREDLEPGDVGLAYVVGERIRRFVLTKHIAQE